MIWLLRHGRTALNAQGLLQGQTDPPLDDTGVEQATAAAAAVKGHGITAVVSSPLQRCRATAALVAAALDVELQVDERWIELDYGELDGTPLAELPPATWAAWRSDLDWAPPGGESIATLGARVRPACEDLAAAGEDVLVVSHVSPIKAAVAWALGVGDEIAWHLHLSPASFTRIAVDTSGRRRSLHAFNDVSHLG
jgi:broad specificity phosphatase PhoE